MGAPQTRRTLFVSLPQLVISLWGDLLYKTHVNVNLLFLRLFER